MELQFSCRHAEHDQDSFSGIVVLFHLPLYAVPVLFCSLVELFYGSFQSHAHLETRTNAGKHHFEIQSQVLLFNCSCCHGHYFVLLLEWLFLTTI